MEVTRLLTTLDQHEAVIKQAFGTPAAFYADWTSTFIKLAARRHIGDYRAYCAGAVAGASAISAAISSVAHRAEDPTADRFIRDYVRRDVGTRTRAALEKLLSGEIDVLLHPKPGWDWTEVSGVRLARRDRGSVAELDEPELRVVTAETPGKGFVLDPGAGLLVVEPTPTRGSSGSPRSIVVETGESGEEMIRKLGAAQLTASSIRLGYDDVGIFGMERDTGPGATVCGLRMGADVPGPQVRAVGEAQDRLLLERRHGIIPAEAVTDIAERARSTLAGLQVEARAGAEDVIAGFSGSNVGEYVPAALAADAAGELKSALLQEIGAVDLAHKAGGPPTPPSDSRGTDHQEPRQLAVDVRGDLSSSEEEIFVLVRLVLPGHAEASYLSGEFDVDLWSPVTVEVAVVGFEVLGDASVEVKIEPGKRSPLYAFQLRILPTPTHSVVVYAVQNGVVLGQVPIATFPSTLRLELPVLFAPPADLRVTVDSNGQVSFWDRGTGRKVRCAGVLASAAGSRARLDRLVQDIDANTENWDDARLEREILELGECARAELPAELVEAMRQCAGLTIHITHPESLDFPFELARLFLDGKEVLVGEVHAVTRWIDSCVGRGVNAEERLVRQAALATADRVRRKAPAGYQSLQTSLRERCAIENFDSLNRLDADVLQTDSYQLLDVVAHLADGTGLALKDGLLRVTSFREPQSAFCSGAALVFLNACSSSGRLSGPFNPHSYPGRLLEKGVGALVASTLPVNVKVAVSLARHFYEGLGAGKSLGRALLEARLSTIADDTTGTRAGTRRLTALAYCAFGHPEMTLKFETAVSTTLEEAS